MFLKCHDFFKTKRNNDIHYFTNDSKDEETIHIDDESGTLIINTDTIRFVRPYEYTDDKYLALIDLFDTSSVELDFVATTSFDEFKEFLLTLPNFILVHDSEICSAEIILNTKYIQMIEARDGFSEIDIIGAHNTNAFWVDESINDLKDVIVKSCTGTNSSLVFRTFGDD